MNEELPKITDIKPPKSLLRLREEIFNRQMNQDRVKEDLDYLVNDPNETESYEQFCRDFKINQQKLDSLRGRFVKATENN